MSAFMTTDQAKLDVLLAKSPAEYKQMHSMNQKHPQIGGLVLGTTFRDQAGDLCIYTGVNGRNRKFPCCFTRVHDAQQMKGTMEYFGRVRRAMEKKA